MMLTWMMGDAEKQRQMGDDIEMLWWMMRI